ncbi:MAG TPA: TlpA disulfide reductase family protein [Pyrinomonadaceae bacterium]|nr:TlpA disulfide reductase family protein [Pyrinomonadaceae bacterium]
MKKIVLLLLITIFSSNALAQSGRRATKPPPTIPPPVVESSEAEPRVAPPSPMAVGVLPQSLLNRELKSLDKGSFRLSDFNGKVVVLNLWASWCGPCRMEVPEYERVRKEYAGRGVEFIALTTEDPRTASDRVKQFVREFKFGFRHGWADPETAVTLMNGRNIIPQTYVISPDGRVVSHWRGFSRDRSGERLREALAQALPQ